VALKLLLRGEMVLSAPTVDDEVSADSIASVTCGYVKEEVWS